MQHKVKTPRFHKHVTEVTEQISDFCFTALIDIFEVLF